MSNAMPGNNSQWRTSADNGSIGYRASVVVAILLVPMLVFGQDRNLTETKTTGAESSTKSATSLTAVERDKADAWQLSETEWQRYRALMLGVRGSVSSSTLSPIEVLGIHARDGAERREYARRWAAAMRDDTERVLAFQRAYDAAAERLFAGQPLIDAGRLKTVPQMTSALHADDRLLFFTRIDCPACEAMLVKLLSHLKTVAGIDIYFTNLATGNDARIREWADDQRLEPGWVQHRRITLNFDGGLLDTIGDGDAQTPVVFRHRNGTLAPLEYADL